MTVDLPEELKLKVIEQLEDAVDEDDIILSISEQTGLSWPETQEAVERIRMENANKIALAQSPLLIALALVIFLAGLAICAYPFYRIYSVYELYVSGMAIDPSIDLPLKAVVIFYLTSDGPGFLGEIILGLGMMIGSLKGMTKVWEEVFTWMGIE